MAELLIGKQVLWLVSLNQLQRADANMVMALKMGNKLEKGAVRRLICRLDVLYILPRTSTMIFFFHNGKNSRNKGVLEELCGLGWKESLCFLDIVLIANDQVGVLGLFVVILLGLWNHIGSVSNFTVCNFKILHNFLSWCGIEIDLFLKSYFGMWVYLDWRSCDINVKINVKIGFLLIRFSRAQLYPWLRVFLFHVSYVNRETGRYGRNELSISFWTSMEWFRAQRKEIS